MQNDCWGEFLDRERDFILAEGFALGGFDAACSEVERGSKPAACSLIPTRWLQQATEIARQHHCNVLVKQNAQEGWSDIWIYCHEHLRDVIESVPQRPDSPFDHWILGKLFGYSEAEIARFVQRTQRAQRMREAQKAA